MRKTFVIGFMGLFLVGGFLTGLYLINQPTNPATSASEIVRPTDEPNVVLTVQPTVGEETQSVSTELLEKCKVQYGKNSQDADFLQECDLDNNGLINVLDLSKMK